MTGSSSKWNWVNLPGGFQEKVVVDLVGLAESHGTGLGRGCVLIQTNATSAFRVIFSEVPTLPIRDSDNPALCFVVGKRKNSCSCVGFGSPYVNKEPAEVTTSQDALLTSTPEKTRIFWFLYDKEVGVCAMGVQHPQPDFSRLVCRFGEERGGFRREICENLRYVVVSSGKRPVSLNLMSVMAPPEVSIPQYKFDPRIWTNLPWFGNSLIFDLDQERRRLVKQCQEFLMASEIANLYAVVDPDCLCLNAYPMLDPLNKSQQQFFPGEDPEEVSWKRCHDRVARSCETVLNSASWTYWPLAFDRADCTTVHLKPTGERCKSAIQAWMAAVQEGTGLPSQKNTREALSFAFAFEVFPVIGENNQKHRREVVRKITEHLEKNWRICEFAEPRLVCWKTHTDFVPFSSFESSLL